MSRKKSGRMPLSASIMRRQSAYLIDLLLLVLAGFLAFKLSSSWIITVIVVLEVLLVQFLGEAAFGTTAGSALVGIVVVDDRTGRAPGLRLQLRRLPALALLQVSVVGPFLVLLVSKEGKTGLDRRVGVTFWRRQGSALISIPSTPDFAGQSSAGQAGFAGQSVAAHTVANQGGDSFAPWAPMPSSPSDGPAILWPDGTRFFLHSDTVIGCNPVPVEAGNQLLPLPQGAMQMGESQILVGVDQIGPWVLDLGSGFLTEIELPSLGAPQNVGVAGGVVGAPTTGTGAGAVGGVPRSPVMAGSRRYLPVGSHIWIGSIVFQIIGHR